MKTLITLAVAVLLMASCSKEELVLPSFNIEVVHGQIDLLYEVDGVSIVQRIEKGYKPVLRDDIKEIEVVSFVGTVYSVNGVRYQEGRRFTL